MREPGEPLCPADAREDANRLDALYRAHAPRLTRRLNARLRSREDAADLVQDAFTRLAGSGTMAGLRRPEAFLNRIVRNLLIDRTRRRLARGPHSPIEDVELAIAPVQEQELELQQMRDAYRTLVAALPPRTREVFLLHRSHGLCYRQIAERLGISQRTAEWHVAEAIVRISKGLDGHEHA